MPRGKKSPTLKDAIKHKAEPAKFQPGAVAGAAQPNTTGISGAIAQAQAQAAEKAAAKTKRTPTLEEVVAKLKQHGIHFDHE